MRFSEGLLVRPLVPGIAPQRINDRTFTADWPLPVLRTVRQMLSGERPREVILIAPRKGEPAWLIEPEPRPRHPLYLYGAGHVGRAVVRALEPLPFEITWVDVAAERFPREVPSIARTIVSADPTAIARSAPDHALHLIMTFSHALDLAVCHAVLSRDFLWAGLIGSLTKRARFERRLREGGIDERAIAGLQCPIGIGGITAKEPAMIAVSVAAQLAAVITSSQIRAQTGGQKHGA
jgi:xanthine dehydrogenase accessory factor